MLCQASYLCFGQTASDARVPRQLPLALLRRGSAITRLHLAIVIVVVYQRWNRSFVAAAGFLTVLKYPRSALC